MYRSGFCKSHCDKKYNFLTFSDFCLSLDRLLYLKMITINKITQIKKLTTLLRISVFALHLTLTSLI